MGGGKTTTTQNVISDPWGPAQPLLKSGLDRAQEMFDAGTLTPDPFGSKLAPESAWSSNARDMMANIATSGNSVIPDAQEAYRGVLNSSFDGLDAVEDAALRKAVPAAASYFEKSGMLNSTTAAEGIGEAAARAVAPIKYDAYNRDRATTLGALGMAPGMADLAYGDARALASAGAAADVRNQMELEDDYATYMEAEDADYNDLTRVAQLGMGYGGVGGTSSGTTTQSRSLGPFGILGNVLKVGGAIAPLFSDRRLKENIKKVGETDVKIPVYSYNYKGDPTPQVGVMSDEVPRDKVIKHPSGYDMVDYGRL